MATWQPNRRPELSPARVELDCLQSSTPRGSPSSHLDEEQWPPAHPARTPRLRRGWGEKSHFGDERFLWTLLSNKAARLSQGSHLRDVITNFLGAKQGPAGVQPFRVRPCDYFTITASSRESEMLSAHFNEPVILPHFSPLVFISFLILSCCESPLTFGRPRGQRF